MYRARDYDRDTATKLVYARFGIDPTMAATNTHTLDEDREYQPMSLLEGERVLISREYVNS